MPPLEPTGSDGVEVKAEVGEKAKAKAKVKEKERAKAKAKAKAKEVPEAEKEAAIRRVDVGTMSLGNVRREIVVIDRTKSQM